MLHGFLCWDISEVKQQCQTTFVQWLVDTLWSTCFCVFQSNFFAVSKIFLYIVTSLLSPVKKPGSWIWWVLQKTQNWLFSFNSLAGLSQWIATWADTAGGMARALSPSTATQDPLPSLLTLPLPLGHRIICVFSTLGWIKTRVDQNVNDCIFLRKSSFWWASCYSFQKLKR